MPRFLQLFLGILMVAMLIGVPVKYASYRQSQVRNFRAVHEGVLYRSGQMTIAGLQSVIHDYGIKTVITLRDAYKADEAPPDRKEEEFCEAEAINYYRIPPRNWWAPDGSVPAEKGVKLFWEVMDNPKNYPVLIHCYAGIHRTGAFCAIYRMEYEHWSNAQAIEEMRSYGYIDLEDEWDLRAYLEQYRPRWQRADDYGSAGAAPQPEGRPIPTRMKPRRRHNFE